jgi:hypothetical protein
VPHEAFEEKYVDPAEMPRIKRLGVVHVTLSEEMSMASKAHAILRGAASGRTGLLMALPALVLQR